jgi:hypothetical protein
MAAPEGAPEPALAGASVVLPYDSQRKKGPAGNRSAVGPVRYNQTKHKRVPATEPITAGCVHEASRGCMQPSRWVDFPI